MKKGSVFAGKKGPLAAGFGTPVNMSSASSSFFDSSLQQMPHLLPGPPRNWQATPLKSHRLPPHHYQQQSNSASSIRAHPAAAATNTPNTSLINRAKPYSLQGLVENLNEVSSRSILIPQRLSFPVTCRIGHSAQHALRIEVRFRRHSLRSRCSDQSISLCRSTLPTLSTTASAE